MAIFAAMGGLPEPCMVVMDDLQEHPQHHIWSPSATDGIYPMQQRPLVTLQRDQG